MMRHASVVISQFIRRHSIVLMWVVMVLGLARVAGGAAWNEFRGPNGSGVGVGAKPPVMIDGAHATWVVDVPAGQSSPVLSDELVFLTGVEGDRLVTLAYERKTGQLAWRRMAPKRPMEKAHESSSPAASTPYVDGDHVYVYFGSYGLLCYDHAGRERWSRPMPTPRSKYGMTCSPVVFGELLILVMDTDSNLPNSKLTQSKIIALDRKTGQRVWMTRREFHRSGWSTPTLWQHGDGGVGVGGTELVVLGNGRVSGYDAATGEVKWHVNGFSRETTSRPIAGAGVVYVSASMMGGVSDEQPDLAPYWDAVMQFDGNGDGKIERQEMTGYFTIPFRPNLPPSHPGYGMPMPSDPVQRGQRLDRMFAQKDKNQDGFWTKKEYLDNMSFSFPGKPNMKAIRPGGMGDVSETHVAWTLNRGIPEVPTGLLYEGRLYLVNDGGVLTVVDAANGKMIYRDRLNASGHYRSSPVVANGHLYVISQEGVLSVVKTGAVFEKIHQYDFAELVSATPAIEGSTIYIRTATKLFAFSAE